MEPITTLTYLLSSFFGYYIGLDIWNQIKFRSEFDEIKSTLDRIQSNLNRIDSKLD